MAVAGGGGDVGGRFLTEGRTEDEDEAVCATRAAYEADGAGAEADGATIRLVASRPGTAPIPVCCSRAWPGAADHTRFVLGMITGTLPCVPVRDDGEENWRFTSTKFWTAPVADRRLILRRLC